MFVIPIQDILQAGNTKEIRLRTTIVPNAKFNTANYLVQI